MAAHFRPLGTDKDPQSQKSCKKSEIFVFATDRSLRQERNPTKNAWTPPSEGKSAGPPQSKQAKPHEPTRPTGQNLRKAQGPSNGSGAEPEKLTRVPARARETPQKLTRPPATATGRISRRRAATMEARKARQGGRNTDTVRKTKKGPLKLLGGPF